MTRSKRQILISLFIIPLLYLSCRRENMCDCLKGTGDITSETRSISSFNKISLENNINLTITEDTIFSLTVEAGSKLLPLIKTEVTDSCLYLKNNNKCNWVRNFKDKINVYLRCRMINEITYKSSGNITSTDTLHADNFIINDWDGTGTINLTLVSNVATLNFHTGPADLNLKGKSETTYLYSAGNGKTDLINFISNFCHVSNRGTNNCYVYAAKELDAQIHSIGDIYYTGTYYKVTPEITGSGHLIPF